MGVFDNVLKAMDDYGRKHKEHMVQQWEKQAEKAKAAEPQPLTETQRVWQSLRDEREQQEHAQHARQQLPSQQPASSQVASTPVFTVTWKIRMSGLQTIPLPWATN